jgi:undecaprenyl-diphosphatase
MTSVARVVTWLGSSVVMVPVIVAVGAFFLVRRRDWRPGLALVAAFGGAVILYNVVKQAVERPRPPAAHMIGQASGFAFPSGHATGAIALWGMLAVVLWARGPRRLRALVWPSAFLIVWAVGASRLYLGVHWFTDVLGGYALGGLWLAVLLSIMQGQSGRRAPIDGADRPPQDAGSDVAQQPPVPARAD